MRLAAITLDDDGGRLAARIRDRLGACDEFRSGRDGGIADLFARCFAEYQGIVCVMAAGIAVRLATPLARDKRTDPAIVVVDDEARWAVSLLSGHEGGANALAYEVAAAVGAEPVITTGSDTRRRITLGVGCRKGVSADEVKSAVRSALAEAGVPEDEVRRGASIRGKRNESGLLEAFRELSIPLLFIPEEEINAYDGPYERGGAAERNIGVRAVAEPCALLAGRAARLVLPKRVYGPVTVAVAREDEPEPEETRASEGAPASLQNRTKRGGSLAIVGLGPGGLDHLTRAAERELREADLVVGYPLYLDLAAPLIRGKETYSSPMRREAERAQYAVDAARAGRRVAVVAGGDACVYGIGGLVLERLTGNEPFPVAVVPGITAANAAAAVLGSPLMNDYLVLSLSDILTDRDSILRKVRAAADSGLAVALYNPRSRSRVDLLDEALAILLAARGPTVPAGFVRNALRPGQEVRVMTLGEAAARAETADMHTVVVVASPESRIEGGRILTPRGYAEERGPTRCAEIRNSRRQEEQGEKNAD